jgi:hypothetical protein
LLGTFYGNLKEGLVIEFHLFVAKGWIRFYLKDGADGKKELWVAYHVKVLFDGTFDGDEKILSF